MDHFLRLRDASPDFSDFANDIMLAADVMRAFPFLRERKQPQAPSLLHVYAIACVGTAVRRDNISLKDYVRHKYSMPKREVIRSRLLKYHQIENYIRPSFIPFAVKERQNEHSIDSKVQSEDMGATVDLFNELKDINSDLNGLKTVEALSSEDKLVLTLEISRKLLDLWMLDEADR